LRIYRQVKQKLHFLWIQFTLQAFLKYFQDLSGGKQEADEAVNVDEDDSSPTVGNF